jgi:hypothetical protein
MFSVGKRHFFFLVHTAMLRSHNNWMLVAVPGVFEPLSGYRIVYRFSYKAENLLKLFLAHIFCTLAFP